MNEFKAGLILAAVVVGLAVLAYVQTVGPESVSNLSVTHVYEDGCMDVYDRLTGVYALVCPGVEF